MYIFYTTIVFTLLIVLIKVSVDRYEILLIVAVQSIIKVVNKSTNVLMALEIVHICIVQAVSNCSHYLS